MPKAEEIRDPQGGRNRIRRGDAVKVTAGPYDPTGFRARFVNADIDEDGDLVAITVWGGRRFDPARPEQSGAAVCEFRIVRPQRVRRMSQAHVAAQS